MKKTVDETMENISVEANIEPADAKIVKHGDDYVLAEADGTEHVLTEKVPDGAAFILPKNCSNRKYFNIARIDAAVAKDGYVILTYKASRTIGTVGKHIPNEKLIAYLPEDLQNEYRAIIERAIKAREDAKSKPMTDLEKAQAKLEKAKAAYEKLMAQANAQ